MKSLAAVIVVVNAALYWPLFLPGETPYRGSIEGGYAAMARFIAAHPNPWGWNPTQYCGLPTQFTYLPGLHYLAALSMRMFPSAEPLHVYRIVAAVFACLGPAAVFFFVLYFTRSRWWALAAGLAYTLVSPAYGLLRVVEQDRGVVDLPWRLQVLVKYGEGPHTAGLALMPLALAAVWAAGTGFRYRQVFAAAVTLAAVALTHWIAGLALAFCCAMLLATVAGQDAGVGFRMRRVIAAGLLAYGLACFWLTPTFLKTIAFNWPVDAFNYRLERQQVWLLLGLAAGLLLVRLAFQRFPNQQYLCFLVLCCFGFGWLVLFYDAYRWSTIPESRRYTTEFELFLLLALCECFRLALASRDRVLRGCAIASGVILLAAGAGQAWRHITQGWSKWGLFPKEQSVEFRLAAWLASRQPAGRIFASGGLRYRLNAWFDLPQVGGTFETGLRNRLVLDYEHQIRNDIGSAADTLRKLQELGVEYLVVHGPASKEYYRDFKNPRRFDALLERVYNQNDDAIYRVPFRSLPVNYDPGWVATQNGRETPVERDKLGFVAMSPGLRLRYRGTTEQRVMAALSALVWLIALAALFKHR